MTTTTDDNVSHNEVTFAGIRTSVTVSVTSLATRRYVRQFSFCSPIISCSFLCSTALSVLCSLLRGAQFCPIFSLLCAVSSVMRLASCALCICKPPSSCSLLRATASSLLPPHPIPTGPVTRPAERRPMSGTFGGSGRQRDHSHPPVRGMIPFGEQDRHGVRTGPGPDALERRQEAGQGPADCPPPPQGW